MKKIKQLQNNFTTPEQSQRLLELGVPADSADMRYLKLAHGPILQTPYIVKKPSRSKNPNRVIPCWSVGRLIEIHAMCAGASSSYYINPFPTNIMNEVMWHLTEAIEKGWIDFSKLEN